MIGTTGATVLLIANLVFATLLGIGVGGLTCLVLRRRWGLRAAIIDAAIALVVGAIAAYAVAAIETARGVWGSSVTLVLSIAAGSVVVRHLLGVLSRPPRSL